MKKGIYNEAILASAGSGKTYQLANRYVSLLAHGFTPDQICAMTFSRKAAAEIFEAVVGHLCSAAESACGSTAAPGSPGSTTGPSTCDADGRCAGRGT